MFIVTMGTLSVAHLYRQITNYGVHAVDFSGWVTSAIKMSFTCVVPFATLETRSRLKPKFVSHCSFWDRYLGGTGQLWSVFIWRHGGNIYWCPKQILWELNSFLVQMLSFVPINLHRRWPRSWKHSIGQYFFPFFSNSARGFCER